METDGLTNKEMKIMTDMAFRMARISNRHRGSGDVIEHLHDVIEAFGHESAIIMKSSPSNALLNEFAGFFLKESNSLFVKGMNVLTNTHESEVAMVFFGTLGDFIVDISGVFRVIMLEEDHSD